VNKDLGSTMDAEGDGGKLNEVARMKVVVHVRGVSVPVQCGDGSQNIRWLATVALFRMNPQFGLTFGVPRGVRLEDGSALDMEGIVAELLTNDSQVWVVLPGMQTASHHHPYIAHNNVTLFSEGQSNPRFSIKHAKVSLLVHFHEDRRTVRGVCVKSFERGLTPLF
jgi:hypothetical protein